MDAFPAEEEGRQPQRWDTEGMRASLTAVRAAQAEARARNRRETLKARLLVGTAVVTFAVGLVATRTRAARRIPPRAPAVAAPVAPIAAPAAPLAALPVAAPAAPTSAPVETATADDASVGECEALCKQHRWRQAAEPCALAVKARPDDAKLVLGLAQSEHARNRWAEAGAWAKRAIALDANLAEAYVIQAHAEARAGNASAAARDFRRYLALAPRGWHAREARAALRAHQADRSAL
jgi:tetratricopeptide (TPR) repeat protein